MLRWPQRCVASEGNKGNRIGAVLVARGLPDPGGSDRQPESRWSDVVGGDFSRAPNPDSCLVVSPITRHWNTRKRDRPSTAFVGGAQR